MRLKEQMRIERKLGIFMTQTNTLWYCNYYLEKANHVSLQYIWTYSKTDLFW